MLTSKDKDKGKDNKAKGKGQDKGKGKDTEKDKDKIREDAQDNTHKTTRTNKMRQQDKVRKKLVLGIDKIR